MKNINSIQIEIINYNFVDDNFNFLSNLESKYKFHNPNLFQNIDFNQLCQFVKTHLKNIPAADTFLSRKRE